MGAPTALYIRIDCHITLQQVQAFHILAQTVKGRPIFPSSTTKYAIYSKQNMFILNMFCCLYRWSGIAWSLRIGTLYSGMFLKSGILECRHMIGICIHFVCWQNRPSWFVAVLPCWIFHPKTKAQSASVIPRLTNLRKLSASFWQLQTLARKLCQEVSKGLLEKSENNSYI